LEIRVGNSLAESGGGGINPKVMGEKVLRKGLFRGDQSGKKGKPGRVRGGFWNHKN